ncbi:1911_t:CDS:2, partial [Ambispora gerdemannii]
KFFSSSSSMSSSTSTSRAVNNDSSNNTDVTMNSVISTTMTDNNTNNNSGSSRNSNRSSNSSNNNNNTSNSNLFNRSFTPPAIPINSTMIAPTSFLNSSFPTLTHYLPFVFSPSSASLTHSSNNNSNFITPTLMTDSSFATIGLPYASSNDVRIAGVIAANIVAATNNGNGNVDSDSDIEPRERPYELLFESESSSSPNGEEPASPNSVAHSLSPPQNSNNVDIAAHQLILPIGTVNMEIFAGDAAGDSGGGNNDGNPPEQSRSPSPSDVKEELMTDVDNSQMPYAIDHKTLMESLRRRVRDLDTDAWQFIKDDNEFSRF